MTFIIFLIITLILVYVVASWNKKNEQVYKYIATEASQIYNRISPYSYSYVKEKAKELGQEYTLRQYIVQATIFAVVAAGISYLYFYNIIISIIYALLAVGVVPYISYLRCKRIYNEFIFEQIQVYTTKQIFHVSIGIRLSRMNVLLH